MKARQSTTGPVELDDFVRELVARELKLAADELEL